MFCKFCGKQLKDNARFCSGCGKACDEPLRQELPRQEPPKQEPARRPTAAPATTLLGQLQQAHAVCCRTNVYFEKAAELENEAAALGFLSQKRKKNFIVANVIGVIVTMGSLLMFTLIGIPFVIIAQKKRAKQADELRQQASREREHARDIFEENYALLSFLPVDYWYPMATEYMIKMVQTDRAANLPSALDLFDAQLHRWKVEDANAQIIRQQQMQTSQLQGIRTSSAVNAAASVANVAFNIARHL